jgi:hypothetical protein
VAVDCADAQRLARFWAEVLGYRLEDPPSGYRSWPEFSNVMGGAGEAWSAVVDPEGVGPRILFHRVPEAKTTKNRVHLDVRVSGPRGTSNEVRRPLVDAEVKRLIRKGRRTFAPSRMRRITPRSCRTPRARVLRVLATSHRGDALSIVDGVPVAAITS